MCNTCTADILAGKRRFVWWDGALWCRTYRAGGFDGYRTLGRKLPCATLATYVRQTEGCYAPVHGPDEPPSAPGGRASASTATCGKR
jgi:hypothetical protein